MAPLTVHSLAAPAPLTVHHRVRFTEEQDRLLQELSRRGRRNISQVLRDVVISWAANTVNEEAELRGEDAPIDVRALVAELNSLVELEADDA